MTHIPTKTQGQRSINSNDRLESDGSTDATNCFLFPDNTAGNDDSVKKNQQWTFVIYSDKFACQQVITGTV